MNVESVQLGEKVVLSNGVRGFGWGLVQELKTTAIDSTAG